MKKLSFWIGIIAILWLGMIFAIGMESIVKFTTPTLTKIVAFDVGRVVFAAFNKLQLALLLIMIGLAFFTKLPRFTILILVAIAITLSLQMYWLFPELSARVDLLISGVAPPSTYKHGLYGLLEVIKAVLLFLLGVRLLA